MKETSESDSLNKQKVSTKILAEIAIFVALATALSFVIVYTLPQGGSITAGSMVPIIWLALRRGPKIGLFAGAVYGLIQFAIQPYFLNPLQMLLDYPLAFGVLGVAGWTKKQPVLGASAGIIGRFIMHFAAGVVYWAPLYAPELNPYVYSAVYNGSYLVPELVVSGIIVYLLQKSKALNIYL
ncbi:MAG: energy-coupled thiamine transporter ThiT [Candidatus Bathyarchaeota archaeon]|nr:energy-coupled thiamine transporter ThiT [Candidatus Bathyarchaeota archaeon]